jgi:hypothetical protein
LLLSTFRDSHIEYSMSILTQNLDNIRFVNGQEKLFAGWPSGFQRCFYITKVPPGRVRGCHRHHKSKMALGVAAGSVKIYTQTPQGEQIYELNRPDHWLFLEPTVWRMMYDFSADAVLIVLASEPFTSQDYIDDTYRPIYLEEAAAAQRSDQH